MSYLYRSMKIALATIIICIMLFILLSIITYDQNDPSVLRAFHTMKINNIFGIYGASVADILVQILGYSIILPIVFFLIFAIKIFYELQNPFFFLRLCGILFATIIQSIIISLTISPNVLGDVSYGGVLADYLKYILLINISQKILVLFLIIIFTIIFVMCFGLSLREYKYIIYSIAKIAKCIFRYINFIVGVLSVQRSKLKIDSVTDNNHLTTQKLHQTQDNSSQIKEYITPSTKSPNQYSQIDNSQNVSNVKYLKDISKDLIKALKDYHINGKIINYSIGPIITLFELQLAPGVKASSIISLSEDIARSISATSIRIITMLGKNTIGIEIPNKKREIIYFGKLIISKEYKNQNNELPLILGKLISGVPMITDLKTMPHLLVAGTTGSGKSIAIHTMIMSLLYSATFKKCQFIMIDPKMLELSIYNGIPHLLLPVITQATKAVNALKWVVNEMERRYKLMSSVGVRDILGFNNFLLSSSQKEIHLSIMKKSLFNLKKKITSQEVKCTNKNLPYIVVIIDEIADLMLVAGREIELYIQRIAQMARASGIHLIIATQRPSVDVITGVVKANFPARISFRVASKIDSRTVLGKQGAEKLLGMGDMLYMMPGGNTVRIHGSFVREHEIRDIIRQIK